MWVWCFDQTKPFTWYISVLSLWNCGEKIHINSFSRFICKDKALSVQHKNRSHVCKQPIVPHLSSGTAFHTQAHWKFKIEKDLLLRQPCSSSLLPVWLHPFLLCCWWQCLHLRDWAEKRKTSIYLQELYTTTPWKCEVKLKWSPMNHVW